MVVASKDKKLAHATQQLLASSLLRISTSRYTNFIKLKGIKFYTLKLIYKLLFLLNPTSIEHLTTQ